MNVSIQISTRSFCVAANRRIRGANASFVIKQVLNSSDLPPRLCAQRPAESQVPNEEDDEEGGGSAAKRPAPGFSFRPSPLHKATQSFILRQSAFSARDKPCEKQSCWFVFRCLAGSVCLAAFTCLHMSHMLITHVTYNEPYFH